MSIKWLIYCRVSSKKQVKEWNWLSSQEKRCRDYATGVLWVEVEKVFNDEWISWWVFERKSIKDLMNYIDTHKDSSYTVIFEDLNRLSRDIQVHHLLRAEFRKRWVELQCPNFQFEESPEWTFRENMSVSMAQYEKDKNKQRVLSRQRARLEQWFWCFKVPLWYKFVENTNWWWKIVVEDKRYSKIVKSALQKYASDEFISANDVVRFFHKKWIKVGTIKNGRVTNSNLICRILRNVLYTGYLELPSWQIDLRKAKHKALISMKTYEAIQKKLNSNPQSIEYKVIQNSERKDLSDDFPLRWFLYCEESKKMISWSWSRWRSTRVAYYTFPRKSSMYWKSINRDVLHKEFYEILRGLTPSEDILTCFEKVFLDLLKKRKEIFNNQEIKLKKDVKKIEDKIENFIDRIWNSSNEKLINNYEKKIEILEKEKSILEEKMQKSFTELKNVRTNLKQKLKIASNALYIWNSWNLETKKTLLKLIFPEWIAVNKKKHVRTHTFSLLYQSFSLWESCFNQMVGHPGLEPRTLSLKGTCSTNWANNP